jgi:hypothetical protein
MVFVQVVKAGTSCTLEGGSLLNQRLFRCDESVSEVRGGENAPTWRRRRQRHPQWHICYRSCCLQLSATREIGPVSCRQIAKPLAEICSMSAKACWQKLSQRSLVQKGDYWLTHSSGHDNYREVGLAEVIAARAAL